MASVNKVILIGNIGKDPDVRHTGDGTPVASFSLATTESYKDKNGNWVDQTEWHNIVAWRNLAERTEKMFKKGMQVFVEGRLATRQWDDKEGNKRYTTEVIAISIKLLGKREGTGPAAAENHDNHAEEIPHTDGPDDLPF